MFIYLICYELRPRQLGMQTKKKKSLGGSKKLVGIVLIRYTFSVI